MNINSKKKIISWDKELKGWQFGDRNPMYGKHHTEETKRKISQKNKGRKIGLFTNEHKEKISMALKGKKFSKERKENISKAIMGRTPWNKNKKGLQKAWNKGLTKETDERVEKYALNSVGRHSRTKGKRREDMIGDKNPAKRLIVRQKIKRFFMEHPESHPNRKFGRKGFISKPQLELFYILKEKYSDAELNYPIKTNDSIRFADIGILSLKLDIEYDGLYWHINQNSDEIRDKQLLEVGWKTIRLNENNIKTKLKEI